MPESAPNRVRHSASESTTTASFPGSSSSGRNVRPSAGRTPKTPKKSFVTLPPNTRSVFPSETVPLFPGHNSETMTTRSGCANGNGRNTTLSTALKMAVVAPMPTLA